MRVSISAMLASALIIATWLAPVVAQDAPAGPAPETVVAVIDGKTITRADVIESVPEQYRAQLDSNFSELIDRLIVLTLLSTEAHKQNLQDDPEVEAQVARLTDQAIQEMLIRRYLAATMTEAAIQARYERFKKEVPAQTEVRASHILQVTEQEAKDIIAQLAGGADFAALAREKSTDPTAQQNGGDLGYFTVDRMMPEFAQAAFAMEKGTISQAPVQSQYGWHVIKLVDRRETVPPSLEEARGQVEEMLSGELVTALIDGLRGAAKIEKFNPDGTPIVPQPVQ